MKDLETLRQRRSAAQIRFHQADKTWAKKLPKAPNARYLPIGRGEPGSSLRKLHDAREAALAAWGEAAEAYRKADLEAFNATRSKPHGA